MGREIRRVPADWEHPTDGNGNYKPLYDRTFEEAAEEWLAACDAWRDGSDPDTVKHKAEYPYFWQWNGNPPDPEYYRPKFTSEPTHYQIYETVSEGTPTSPVFASLDDMKAWLIENGHSDHAASEFIKGGWAPSMIMTGGKTYGPGIDSLDAPTS